MYEICLMYICINTWFLYKNYFYDAYVIFDIVDICQFKIRENKLRAGIIF